jgi:hypothetical protein
LARLLLECLGMVKSVGRQIVASVRIWPFAWALILWLSVSSTAFAQGFGGFVSPGPLCSDHEDLDTLDPRDCLACHKAGRGVSAALCMDCHETIKKQVDSKSGFHANKGTACESCHSDHKGTGRCEIPTLGSDFDHEAETGWALEGAHGNTKCISCHKTPNVYEDLDTTCSTCHNDPHGKAQSERTLLQKCDSCHDAADWDALPLPANVFDHTSTKQVDYVLDGGHREVDCVECHFEMRFVPIDHEACTSCHANPHRAEFRTQKCENCHPTAAGWAVQNFDHDLTKYDLEGEHARVGCDECHGRDKTAPMASQRCDNCHVDLHHAQFVTTEGGRSRPKPCEDCHTVQVAAFALRNYDHDTTDYPLVGKHREQACEECHDDREAAVYVDLPHADCDECHTDPHGGRHEPAACTKCHIADGFQIQAFDHDDTDFPHTGKHVGLECNKCHRDFQWTDIPHDSCNDCHFTKNPHQEGMAVEKCDACHVTEAFDVVRFDHVATTGFDLAPAHDDTACASCHPQVKDFEGLDSTCAACHVDDRPWGHYEGDCGDCHEAELWFPAGLGPNEHIITGFALVGAHSLEPCESCHPVGQPRGEAEPDCATCHMRDDPHQNMLGSNCDDCHTEMSWLRTTWRHTATGWPLRGAHRLAACSDCHATGYIGTPTDCFWCHQSEAPLGIPAHQSPDFTRCDACHRVFAWSPVSPLSFPH